MIYLDSNFIEILISPNFSFLWRQIHKNVRLYTSVIDGAICRKQIEYFNYTVRYYDDVYMLLIIF